MAKDEKITVDEDMIRGMMMREAPALRQAEPVPATEVEPVSREEDVTPAVHTTAKKAYAKRKRKDEADGYAERFLVDDRMRNRISTSINRELYDRIRKFLPLIAPEVAITSYLNNIVADHLDRHWDEISKLLNSELENL